MTGASMRIGRAAGLGMAMAMVIALALPALAATPHDEDFGPEYIDFGGDVKGALYLPDPAAHPSPTIGVLVIHRTGNFLTHPATEELSERGFVVLGMNPHSDNNEAAVDWDRIATDVKAGVEFLKGDVGMEKVVLYGHSGGGPTTSYYQALAENGLAVCQGPDKIVECPEDEDMVGPPADGIIFVDAHPGNTVNRVRSVNPAVVDEDNAGELDPDLNPFLEANGYNPDGCSSYSDDFRTRYFEAQSDRLNDLIDEALSIKEAIAAGTHFPADDDSFVVHRTSARLMELDNTIDAVTENPQKLLTDERDIVTDIVSTVRVCSPDDKEEDESFEGSMDLTVESFLGANAIRSTNSMYDIDWCSSNNSVPCMVQQVEVPTLVAAAQGHYFMRDGEHIYEMSAADNKDFVIVEGATHGIDNCNACEGGPYFNARDNFFDYIAKWMNTDFTPVTELEPALRVAGPNRIGTAVALSREAFGDGADSAVVARADDFADALGGAPLATAAAGPLLLTAADGLSDAVGAELERLGVSTVYLMGGEGALSPAVEEDIADLGVTVQRLAGGDRYGTAAAAASQTVELWEQQAETATAGAIVALGTDFADALAGGVLAAYTNQPLLFTAATTVPDVTIQALAELGAETVTVLGGEAAVSAGALAALDEHAVTRLAGDTRFHTAEMAAAAAVEAGANGSITIVASGRTFPDALAAGPAAHALGGVLLLTEPETLPAVTANWISSRSPMELLRIAGGTAAVSAAVETELIEANDGVAEDVQS